LKFLNELNHILIVLGIPGLLLISFLDSAAVPLAGGPDAVVILFAWQRPRLAPLIVTVAALGSVLGCLVLYRIGRAGGQLALARFSEKRKEWVQRHLDRSAFWTVFAAVLIPPPFPTKPVILASGVFHMRLDKFWMGVLAGRLVRYGIEAYLGAQFGRHAVAVIKEHTPIVLIIVLADVLLVLLVNHIMRRKKK
jgi:membrane protein YqaA with SNARE-associated domain